MSFLDWVKGVAVSLSTLIGTCYGSSWPISLQSPCEQATAHIDECLALDTSCSGECGTVECAGTAQCTSECINDASCISIQDLFGGMPSSLSKDLLDCVTSCAAAQ